MNQLKGILLGLMLISGFVPYSFAHSNYDDSHFFKSLKYFSGDVTTVAYSDSVLEFNKAAVVLTSSTTTTSPTKETICHIPSGNPNKSHTITVGVSAVLSHLAHGDYLGKCNKISGFDTAKVITSSNTGVTLLYSKVIDLKSNPPMTFEALKEHVSSVSNLIQFLSDADKQDTKEFKKLFHDYKKAVKQLLKKADKQSKHTVENILEQTEDALKTQHHEKHKEHKESKHKESKSKNKKYNHKDN